MTCAEARAKILAPIDEATRADRAAVQVHLDACPDCDWWLSVLEAVARRLLTPEQNAERDRTVIEMYERDMQDPEFVRTVYGERP